jgi:cytoskeletal protein RodZ
LGQRLREAREAKELSLADVEQATRIRLKYLEALELGNYASMTPVQAQGFLRNYARFLGLDLGLLLQELESEPAPRRARQGPRLRRRQAPPARTDAESAPLARILPVAAPAAPAAPRRMRPRRARRSFLSSALIVIVAGTIVAAAVLGGTRLADRLAESQTQLAPADTEPLPTPSPGELTAAESTPPAGGEAQPEPEVVAPPASPAEPFTPPTLTGTSVTVLIEITQPSWVRVATDGVVRYEGLAQRGDILNYSGQQSVGVRANNAAGLNLTVNNQPQGALGERGQLFDYTFTLAGVEPSPPEGPANGDAVSGLFPATDTALPTASPEGATLLFEATPDPLLPPTATLPLDPGDLSVLEAISPTPLPGAPPQPTPTPPFTFTPTSSPTATPTTTPTVTPLPSPTPTATGTPRPTATRTPTPSATPSPTATPTFTPTWTPSPTATASPTPTPTPTRTPSPTATTTPTPTPTWTPTFTPSRTPTPTPTATHTPSPTWSPTPTFTATPTPFLPPRYTRTPTPPPK